MTTQKIEVTNEAYIDIMRSLNQNLGDNKITGVYINEFGQSVGYYHQCTKENCNCVGWWETGTVTDELVGDISQVRKQIKTLFIPGPEERKVRLKDIHEEENTAKGFRDWVESRIYENGFLQWLFVRPDLSDDLIREKGEFSLGVFLDSLDG